MKPTGIDECLLSYEADCLRTRLEFAEEQARIRRQQREEIAEILSRKPLPTWAARLYLLGVLAALAGFWGGVIWICWRVR